MEEPARQIEAAREAYSDYVIKPAQWGEDYPRYHPPRYATQTVQSAWPIVDHSDCYSFRPAGCRGPARRSQKFIASYTYQVAAAEPSLLERLDKLNLRYHKEPCRYGGHDAYFVLIYGCDVNLETVLRMLPRKPTGD